MDEHAQELNPEVHHEERDVNFRIFLLLAGAFVVIAIVLHVAIYFMFEVMKKQEARKSPAPISLVAITPGERVGKTPRLQPFPYEQKGRLESPLLHTPVEDMEKMNARESEILTTYGWVDRAGGVVRIPVERAMQIVVSRRLPVRAAAPVLSPGQKVPEATAVPLATSSAIAGEAHP